MLTSDILLVYGVILIMLLLLYREYVQPALIFLAAVLVFYVKGIISVEEITHGFGNSQVLLIFLLLIISDIIKKTEVLDKTIDKYFNPHLNYKGFMLRMAILVSGMSAWLNNTPIVAFITPYVYQWSKKKGISPSKVLLPLSYLAILGGTATLIGTSTNLIVNGMALEAGFASLEIFDFFYIGVPLILLGTLFIAFFGFKLLPSRKALSSDFKEHHREYMVETFVPVGSELIGKTIDEAKLRNLQGLVLVEVVRNDRIIAPVSPREIICNNDILLFVGETTQIAELVKSNTGLSLSLPDDSSMITHSNLEVVEVIVSPKSYLVGKKAKRSNFRKRYDSAIIAIQRNGEKLSGKLGEVKLQVGDLLLLIVGDNFQERPEVEQDLYVISRVRKFHYFNRQKRLILFGGLIAVLLLEAFKMVPIFVGILILLGMLSFFKIIQIEDLKRSIDLNLFFILVLALAIGKAMTNSGAGSYLAHSILSIIPHKPIFALIGIYFITNVITVFVTNAAAVAISFPISISIANQMGVSDIEPFLLAIAFAGSAGFISPFGYQTNLMVYGPGGYKFKDYVRLGLPLTFIYMIVCITILGFKYKMI